MKKVIAAGFAILLALVWAPSAQAAKDTSCSNCAPTVVVVNGDGSVTVSTTTVPNGGCLGAVSPTKYACNVKVYSASGGVGSYYSTGGPTVISGLLGCPCQAQFWVHAGQWHPYSALSDPFVP